MAILTIIFFVCSIELITVLLRMLFGEMRNPHKKLKIPIRIHHGYLGLVLLAFSLFFDNSLSTIGWALFIADVLHHFAVLSMRVGRTEFP